MKNGNRNFMSLLQKRWTHANSLLCVGLDSDYVKLPGHIKNQFPSPLESLFEFNKQIIDNTADLVCAYKPNPAFYEALGTEGIEALKKTCNYIKNTFPNIPIIIDAKRGDIGNTNKGYAEYVFDFLEADAMTVMPYMGIESLSTYFEYKEKGIIVGCHSSNPGAKEFQELEIDGKPLYHKVAQELMKQHGNNPNCLIFMGATYPEELLNIRKIVKDMTLLVPGVGTQGGNVKTFVLAGINSLKAGLIINSSRGVIFADNSENFAETAREEAKKLRDEINSYR